MKKKLLLFVLAAIGKMLYSENLNLSSFYGLDFFLNAKIKHEMNLLDAEPYRRFFIPGIQFEAEGNISGDISGGWNSLYVSPSLSFTEKLPSMISLKGSIGADMIFSESDNGINCLLSPSLTVSVPLIFSAEMARSWNEAGKFCYSRSKRKADLVYLASIRSGTLDFVTFCGEYIYYRCLCQLNERKIGFLEQKIEDFEKLFLAGKITSMQLEEQSADRIEALKSQREWEFQLIKAQQKLCEAGFSVDLLCDDFCLKEFTDFWNDYIGENFRESYMQDEIDLLGLDIEKYGQVLSAYDRICYVSGGFSLSSSYAKNSFPDFSDAGWQFDFSLSIPVGFDFGNKSVLKKISDQNRSCFLEKERIVRRKSSSEKARSAGLKAAESYYESMKKAVELEEKKHDSYVELNKAGRISNFDVLYQENELAFARLYEDFAGFQLLVTKAGFY